MEKLSATKKPNYIVRSPHDTLVAVYEEVPVLTGEECDSKACEQREKKLDAQFWDGTRVMPDITDPNSLIRYRFECEGCATAQLGNCAMQLVQYDRLGREITRVENPAT